MIIAKTRTRQSRASAYISGSLFTNCAGCQGVSLLRGSISTSPDT